MKEATVVWMSVTFGRGDLRKGEKRRKKKRRKENRRGQIEEKRRE